jgi:hypothetical protein
MNTSNKDANYSLHNVENYKKEFDTNNEEIINKYSSLIVEYYKFIIDNLKIKSKNYVIFIIMRGLDTITHVFLYLLLYTKNIDLTYFHCQKSFYFYVEFVGQISEDDKMFLQLTSRDATTYVYKKTIFDLNADLKKNNYLSDSAKEQINIIDAYVKIYKIILQKVIIENNTNNTELIRSLDQIYDKLNYNLLYKSQIQNLETVISKLYEVIEDVLVFIEIIKQITKQITRKNIKIPNVIHNIQQKINNEILQDKIKDTPDKLISWFFN